MELINEVENYLAVPEESESWDLLKRCFEQMKDDRYFMTEIRSMVKPIIRNSQGILEAATTPK